jgi:hypothetical protein
MDDTQFCPKSRCLLILWLQQLNKSTHCVTSTSIVQAVRLRMLHLINVLIKRDFLLIFTDNEWLI